ncbi:LPS export ABC transporter periplasmic protein LptC [Roseovarius sp. S1116L3]|uniref:LPS export ABC transporter periplasmic protein LptC n=1 Tax=Roseovarius roseus TaxID=3342636 RepID=UPI0037271711
MKLLLSHLELRSKLIFVVKTLLITVAIYMFASIFFTSNEGVPEGVGFQAQFAKNREEKSSQITRPIFSGLSDSGHKIEINAIMATASNESQSPFFLKDVESLVRTTQGSVTYLDAKYGQIWWGNSSALFKGDVNVTTGDGYILTTAQMEVRYDKVFAKSLSPVSGFGPLGNVRSDSMVLNESDDTGIVTLRLMGNVLVTYHPDRATSLAVD